MSFLIAIVVVALVAGGAWLGLGHLKRKLAGAAGSMARLVRDGVATTGRIAAAQKRRMSRGQFEYFVTYSFEANDGTTHEKELRVQATRFDEYAEGQPVEIVYLPDAPSNSAFRDTVEKVRSAMGKGSSSA